MVGLGGLQLEPRALFVVGAVVRHPGLPENLPPETARIWGSPPRHVELQEFRIGTLDLEGMRRGPEPDDRPAPVEVVHDVLHLGIGEILEAQEDDHQVRLPERVET